MYLNISAAGSFTITNDTFMLNGSPFRILSGEVHYARVHPDYWHDRLQVCVGGEQSQANVNVSPCIWPVLLFDICALNM